MLERGIDVSYETVRRWTRKFGSLIARNLRCRQARPGDVWHLDEVVVKIADRSFWLWRAVDQEGVVLDELLQPRRDKRAAKRLLIRLMKRWGFVPRRIITDKLRSYGAAKREQPFAVLKARARDAGLSLTRRSAALRVNPFYHPQLFLRSISPTRRPDYSLSSTGSPPCMESRRQRCLRSASLALTPPPFV